MPTGYEDIDRVMQQQNSLLEQQEQKGNQIIDLGLQKTQAQVDKQKAEYEQEAVKTGKLSDMLGVELFIMKYSAK